VAFVLSCASVASTAIAQRTQDNAVTSAGDAFGVAVGNEKIGLYNVDEVRGFNPIEAGNARIEGLYFDQQDRPSNRTIEGSTIRVGITAQGIPFPAPTGIVDYRLRTTRDNLGASIEIERAPFGGIAGSFETNIPIDDGRLVLALNGGMRRFVQPQGGRVKFQAYGAMLRWKPFAGAEVTALHSGFDSRDEDAIPALFPIGTDLPPEIRRGRFFSQDWAQRTAGTHLSALIAKVPLGSWRIEAGVFRSVRYVDETYADLFRGVRPDGSVAARTIVADADNRDQSTSGEFRVGRTFRSGALTHNILISARGRSKDRAFGGQTAIALGPSTLNQADRRAKPQFGFGDNASDRVRQATLGLGYTLGWAGHGAIAISVSKTDYEKRIDFPDPATPDITTISRPWLYSITGSATPLRGIAIYGGIVRGLEESLIAPDIASNRSEAPPAILTRQVELGVRVTLPARMTLVAGAFSVRKPFFGLDPGLRFGALGTVENRGVEVSLTGQPVPGVTIVAGTVFVDPGISGGAVDNGRIGPRPLGSITRRSILNIDWKPAGQTAWSIDTAIESTSARTGNIANTLEAQARTTLALGGRYRARFGGNDMVLRVQVTNLFNEYGWLVSNSGGFTYSPARTFIAQLSIDI
jgi:iron complex outermembrane recepter protein